jgi:hypothetical protein
VPRSAAQLIRSDQRSPAGDPPENFYVRGSGESCLTSPALPTKPQQTFTLPYPFPDRQPIGIVRSMASDGATRTQIDLRGVAAITVGTFVLLIPALLNGFPFLFQDSADYLIFTPRLHRSPFYGLFIFFFHLNRFIWGPIVAQALITSHLIYIMVKLHVRRHVDVNFAGLILLLVSCSTLPIFVGYIMPDIFTSLMFIAMYLLAFHFFAFSLPMRLYLLAVACVAMASHLSHLTMGLAILWLVVPLLFWCGRSWSEVRDHLAVLFIPILLTIIAYLSFNSLIFRSTSLAPAGQSFFLANLIEYGPARTYLKSVCPQAGYKICSYAGRLPQTADDFLWKEGNLNELGGFTGMVQESNAIVLAIIEQQPGEFLWMVAKNFAAALNAHKPAVELTAATFPVWTSIFDLVAEKFGPNALAKFRDSAQMQDTVPHDLIERVDGIVLPVAFIALFALGCYAAENRRRDLAALAAFLICAVLGDALLCSTVSGVHDRYQARITWFLPMGVFVIARALYTAAVTGVRM